MAWSCLVKGCVDLVLQLRHSLVSVEAYASALKYTEDDFDGSLSVSKIANIRSPSIAIPSTREGVQICSILYA